MDCEGAELPILCDLGFTPRVVIVEIHPHLGSPVDAVEHELSHRGYEIVARETAMSSDDVRVLTAVQNAE